MTKVSLYKAKRPTRGDPRRQVWLLRWLGTDGKRYCDTVGEVGRMSKRDAEYLRRDRQGRLDCNVARPDRPRRITLAEFIGQHEEAMRASRRVRTIRQYRVAGNHAIAALDGRMAVSRIDAATARRVVRHLVERELSPATIRKTIVKLRTIFSRAVRENFIVESPFAAVELPRVQPRQKRVFTRVEVRKLLGAAPSLWWRSFVTIAVESGLRLEELLHLTWRDVDLVRGVITVAAKRAGRFEVEDEGGFPIFEWSAKTHTERIVQIGDDAVDVLREMREASDGSLYVFVPLERLRALDAKREVGELREDFEIVNNVLRGFKTIQKHAFSKLDGDHPIGTVHDLRKTYGTWMAEVVPMPVLQRLMGHADITTTAKFYVGAVEGYADRIRAALNVETDAQVTRNHRLRLVGGNPPAA